MIVGWIFFSMLVQTSWQSNLPKWEDEAEILDKMNKNGASDGEKNGRELIPMPGLENMAFPPELLAKIKTAQGIVATPKIPKDRDPGKL